MMVHKIFFLTDLTKIDSVIVYWHFTAPLHNSGHSECGQ